MEYKQEVVRRLQQLELLRQAVQAMEEALLVLTPQERLVVQMMYICPEKKAVRKLSELLCLEHTAVYRRKDRALDKLAMALGIDD